MAGFTKSFFPWVIRAAVWVMVAELGYGAVQCGPANTVTATVVALDQPFMYNRLGTAQPQGTLFALERDVVPLNYDDAKGAPVNPSELHGGNVRLRAEKRPRPLVLRVNQGGCLQVNFRNLLDATTPASLTNLPLDTRYASLHVSGLNLVGSIVSDASFVGTNKSGILAPEPANGPPVYVTYTWSAPEEGTFFLYSSADTNVSSNSQVDSEVGAGLFGAVNVEPSTAEYYRSQVTRDGMDQSTLSANDLPPNMTLTPVRTNRGATRRIAMRASTFFRDVPASQLTRDVNLLTTIDERQQTVHTAKVVVAPGPEKRIFAIDEDADKTTGHPIINYIARYPATEPNGRACTPVLKMAAAPMIASGGKCVAVGASSVSATNPIVITTNAPHGLAAGLSVAVHGAADAWSKANGVYPVTVISGTQFSIPVDGSSFGIPFNGRVELPLRLYYSDLTAIITGPDADRFPYSSNSPTFNQNPAEPDRREPFREMTLHYHNAQNVVQPFQEFYNSNLSSPYSSVQDAFAINYGIAGIGAEILANRLGVGPEGNADSVDLKFEEFFLSSWAVGDPAMIVDTPANAPNAPVSPPNSGLAGVNANMASTSPTFSALNHSKATKVFYPDDPSNVYHSYLRDHVKMRILHAGPPAAHVHHLHAHQWLRTPNSDEAHYLDSQMLTPGAAYTLEIAYGGSGNRNLTVGDSIFHCHFYPHFAGGMWGLWRVHDVFESGTKLVNGVPEAGVNRVLPDGEINTGTPIPAVVPLPTLAMAPIPADVRLTDAYQNTGPSGVVTHDGRRIEVIPESTSPLTYRNPGYPFFVPGVAGHRPPHPPLDFAWKVDDTGEAILGPDGKKQSLDGGLPRHVVLGGKVFRESHTRWDFTKDFVLYDSDHKTLKDGLLMAYEVPEEGTAVERAAMTFHSSRTHRSFLPNGDPGNFVTNGTPPVSGAPFSGPGVTDSGNTNINTRRYKGANIQMDVVFNKKGWHFPQERMITLWEDVKPTVNGERPPQPFFMRAGTGETVEYWHTNLVPNYYEMDDFQVRTPTDIIGQHIHLVKFDVLASDGAANGWNYEDGTFSPDEVRERIFAVNKKCSAPGKCGMFAFDDGPRQFYNPSVQTLRTVKDYKTEYGANLFGDPPPHQDWNGAQTTIQLWDTDPLLNNAGVDRTLRTVFTHDHFGPSTHQQIGLYGGLLVEPENSTWTDPVTGQRLYDMACYDASGKRLSETTLKCPPGSSRKRSDGGPTSWEAIVKTMDPSDSYREFALEFQDMALAYTRDSSFKPGIPAVALFDQTNTALPTPGRVTTALQQIFQGNGIPLTGSATVAAVSDATCNSFAGSTLVIHDPAPPDQDQNYCVASDGQGGFNVFTASAAPGWSQPQFAIFPNNGGSNPNVISNAQNGTETVAYRNEPVITRVDPTLNPAFPAGDLSYAFTSIQRADPDLNCQPVPGTLISHPCTPLTAAEKATLAACQSAHDYCPFRFPSQPLVPQEQPGGAQNFDPFTPLLRAYQNDKVQIRTLVGAHLTLHSFEVQGLNWLMQPTYGNSGYKSVQGMGLSEHYEMLFNLPATKTTVATPFADYLYQTNAGVDGVANGMWGIVRSFDLSKVRFDNLKTLPNNDQPGPPPADVCAAASNRDKPRIFNVKAIVANLTYYNRTAQGSTTTLADPDGMVYVNADTFQGGAVTEPLILRARAGECIQVNLINGLPASWPGQGPPLNKQNIPPGTFSTGIIQSSPYGANNSTAPLPNLNIPVSMNMGLHPQLLYYDVTQSNGANIGFNPPVTVASGQSGSTPLRWFAGRADGTPVEFGTVVLEPSDPLLQHFTGLYGVLVIEPKDSSWTTDPGTNARATVVKSDLSTFREFVLGFQNDVENQNVSNLQAAFNYTAEPTSVRIGQAAPQAPAQPNPVAVLRSQGRPVEQFSLRTEARSEAAHFHAEAARAAAPAQNAPVPALVARFSDSLFANTTTPLEPQTPILNAASGDPVRIHLAYGGGTPVFNPVFEVAGHSWPENPWLHGSTELGLNPLAQHFGMEQIVPFQASNFLLSHAGGDAGVPGDYLYDMFEGETPSYAPGAWGIMRVRSLNVAITSANPSGAIQGTVAVTNSAASEQPPLAPVVLTVFNSTGPLCTTGSVTVTAGAISNWSCQASASLPLGTRLVATSSAGGSARATVGGVVSSVPGGVVAAARN
ncbi:MAG TPA: hypothetical protein VGL72_25375 [Bryobacteraceae bacterium]|jgi:hypothetical protein